MKQEEKNRRSREHILHYAAAEFAEQGYLGASINAICAEGKISKGLLYHYYTDKDALYLACAEQCFQEILAWMSERLDEKTVTVDRYFDTRLEFFKRHPVHHGLFCDVSINSPPQLREKIFDCRSSFDAWNEMMLRSILEKERLADEVSMRDALWQFRMQIDFVNTQLRNFGREAWELTEHDRLCRQTLHILLYGVVARS